MKPAQKLNNSNEERADTKQLISAFLPIPAGDAEQYAASGNPCLLFMLDHKPQIPVTPAPGVTHCQSWPGIYEGQQVVAVNCYTPGGLAIQCCGHGLLSAAYRWLERLQCEQLLLQMHSSLVPCWREQHNTWLRFERLPTHPVPVPNWVAEIFPAQAQPAAAALCADEAGYFILQWPDETALKLLTPSLTTLAAHSKRALICTAAHPSAGADAVQLRYFAPQYGVGEDPATGSAVRVLADYWSDRFHTLTAEQCSHEGGLLLARVTPTHVEVGGRCELVQMTTQNV